MRRGIVFGKFMPPTMGHKYLVEFARRQTDALFVFVGDVYDDSGIPRSLRADWLRRHFCDGVTVVVADDSDKNAAISSDELINRWRNVVLEAVGAPPDQWFGSEPYLSVIAESVGAHFHMVDDLRSAIPISATQVRSSPHRHWDLILPEARPYFLHEILVVANDMDAVPLAAHSTNLDFTFADLRPDDPLKDDGLATVRLGALREVARRLLVTIVTEDQLARLSAPVLCHGPADRWKDANVEVIRVTSPDALLERIHAVLS